MPDAPLSANFASWQNTEDGTYVSVGSAAGDPGGSGYVSFQNGPNCGGRGGWLLFPYSFSGWNTWTRGVVNNYSSNDSYCPSDWTGLIANHDAEITNQIPWSINMDHDNTGNPDRYINQYLPTIVEDFMLSPTTAERNFFVQGLGFMRIEGWCKLGGTDLDGGTCTSSENNPNCYDINWPSEAAPNGPGNTANGWIIEDCQSFTSLWPWPHFWNNGVGQTVQSVYENYMDGDFWGGL